MEHYLVIDELKSPTLNGTANKLKFALHNQLNKSTKTKSTGSMSYFALCFRCSVERPLCVRVTLGASVRTVVWGNMPLTAQSTHRRQSFTSACTGQEVAMKTLHLRSQFECAIDDVSQPASQPSPASSAVRWPGRRSRWLRFLGSCPSEITGTQQGGSVFA